MSAGGKYNKPEVNPFDGITSTPEPFAVGELSSGARHTATATVTVPIPNSSKVKDIGLIFRDRRVDYDNGTRSTPLITATREMLLTNIPGFTSSAYIFAGKSWRRHEKSYTFSDGSTYIYYLDVVIETGHLLLMIQDNHVGNLNKYGGWENLTVNFDDVSGVTGLEEVEVEEMIGHYIPNLSEGRSVSLVTGISMVSPATHVRIQFTGASGYYEMVLNLNTSEENVQSSPASSTTYHQTYTIPIRMELEDAVTGTIKNLTNQTAAYSIIRRGDVYTRKKVKVLK